jgi:hypothetical protein
MSLPPREYAVPVDPTMLIMHRQSVKSFSRVASQFERSDIHGVNKSYWSNEYLKL